VDIEKTIKNLLDKTHANEEVLLCASIHRLLLNVVKQGKTLYLKNGKHQISHILRETRYILLKIILTGKIEEKRTRSHSTYGSATSGTDVISQTLPLYSVGHYVRPEEGMIRIV